MSFMIDVRFSLECPFFLHLWRELLCVCISVAYGLLVVFLTTQTVVATEIAQLIDTKIADKYTHNRNQLGEIFICRRVCILLLVDLSDRIAESGEILTSPMVAPLIILEGTCTTRLTITSVSQYQIDYHHCHCFSATSLTNSSSQ